MFARVMTALLAVALCTGMTSCTSGGVTIPAGYEALEPCEPRILSVEELSVMEEPGCDLEGSTVVSPDGIGHLIGPVGNVGVNGFPMQDLEYELVNWGVPGVTITRTAKGEPRTTWASSAEALRLQRKALGL